MRKAVEVKCPRKPYILLESIVNHISNDMHSAISNALKN